MHPAHLQREVVDMVDEAAGVRVLRVHTPPDAPITAVGSIQRAMAGHTQVV